LIGVQETLGVGSGAEDPQDYLGGGGGGGGKEEEETFLLGCNKP
jgi:hypothetical protein